MNECDYITKVRNRLFVGDIFQSVKNDLREGHEKYEKRVVAFYPHHVLTVNANGFCECFTYFDLLRMIR